MTHEERQRRFQKALDQGGNTHTIADVLDRIRERKAMCFPSPTGDSVIVCEVLVTPQTRICNYWIVSGRLHECAEMQHEIDAWARDEGCSIAQATGRMGWLRLQQTPLGADWRPAGIKFVKQLQS